MLKPLITYVDKCIKNVYSLRTHAGTTSGELHTGSLLPYQFTPQAVHNSLVTPLFVPVLATQFSTSKISHFNLLYRRLSPQSTPPINKKKKERKEKNT